MNKALSKKCHRTYGDGKASHTYESNKGRVQNQLKPRIKRGHRFGRAWFPNTPDE